MPLDFAGLAASLLDRARTLLPQWLPEGKFAGHEFKVGSLNGEPGDSLSINVRSGVWKDFATGEGGQDLISLYAAIHRIEQGQAFKDLNDQVAAVPVSAPPKEKAADWEIIQPVPAEAPEPPGEFYKRADDGKWRGLKVVARWPYLNTEGGLMGYANRIEWVDTQTGETHKDVIPCVYCQNTATGKRQWRWKAMPKPRVLYNLPELLKRPEAPVIVVEGEKKVPAAQAIAPQYVGVTWAGGCQAWKHTDWRALKGRKVLLWPDADKPGLDAMWAIGNHLMKYCPEVKLIVIEPGSPAEGWDAADAVQEGWDWERFKAWAVPKVQLITERSDDGAERNDGRRSEGAAPAERDGRGTGGEGEQREGTPPWEDRDDAAQVAGDRAPGDQSGAHRDRADGSEGDDRGSAQGSRRGEQVRDGREARDRGRDHKDERTDLVAGAQSAVSSWLSWGLQRNGNGAPLTNLSNAVRVLECAPQFRGIVWFDEFLGQILTIAADGGPRQWTEADDINLTLRFQREIDIQRMGKETVRDAVIEVAMRDMRNCVKDWIESQAWDGTRRLERFFIDVFGAPDTPFTRAVGRNFWLSICARVYQPGCKVDNMIVLEGSQGVGKSTAIALIGGAWYAEQHESATNAKAFAEILQGKLVIEISEMDAFDRAEVKRVKSVVSNRSDRYRPSYGRYAKDHPRQGVMIGSTNKDDWNRDDTGARRFWPIKTRGVNIGLLIELRGQLFAEAAQRYKAGEKWWEVPEDAAKAEQESRFDSHPWIEVISSYLVGRDEVTTNQIMQGPLGMETRELNRRAEMDVAGCLRYLGWEKLGNKRIEGRVRKVWVRASSNLRDDAPEGGYTEVATDFVSTINDLPFE